MTTNRVTSWSTVSFRQGFQVAPVLLTAVTSFNEADAVITRVNGISASSCQIRLQEQLGKRKNMRRRASTTLPGNRRRGPWMACASR